MEKLRGWAETWGVPGLEGRVQFRLSKRMFRSLGRYYPKKHEVRLASFLVEPEWQELYEEVLCHEAAHAACYERFGWNGRPHGREWKSLMTLAGYKPRAQLPQTPQLHKLIQERRAARKKKSPKKVRTKRVTARPLIWRVLRFLR